jgi:hypothetical protein
VLLTPPVLLAARAAKISANSLNYNQEDAPADYSGLLDDVRIYRPLSQAELQADMNTAVN